MKSAILTFCALCCLGLHAGCGQGQPYVSSERLEKGLVIVLTGIEGRSAFNRAICKGLDDGGVDYAIELCDWTARFPGFFLFPPNLLYNLRAEGRNREKAVEIMDRIIRYQIVYPARPVFLVGQSGGGAMAAWVAEALPWDKKVEGIVMLAPALSPQYMLDQALLNSSRGIVNFYSSRDLVMLGVVTTVVGTMDGEHTSSAGRVGFEIPNAGSRPKVYDQLYQIAWNGKMADTGNIGIHLSSGAAKFVSTYLSPLLRAKAWNEEQIARVLNREDPAQTQGPAPQRKPAPATLTGADTVQTPAPAGGAHPTPVGTTLPTSPPKGETPAPSAMPAVPEKEAVPEPAKPTALPAAPTSRPAASATSRPAAAPADEEPTAWDEMEGDEPETTGQTPPS